MSSDETSDASKFIPADHLRKPDGHQCKRCGSYRSIEIPLESVHGRVRIKCQACGLENGIIEVAWANDPVERARRFVLGFGMHKDRTLGQLERNPSGRSYVLYLASLRNARSPNVRAASRAALTLVARSRTGT